MKYVTLLDTETTSLSPETGRCIEVAVCLYDIKLATPIASFASLIGPGGDNPAQHVNGIKPELLAEAPSADIVWDQVKRFVVRADCLVAHRAEFDRKWCPDFGKPWVCTKTDIAWIGDRRGDHLVQLALSLGLGVASAHRAMADVDTMARILTRCAEMGADLEAMFVKALRPKKRFVAIVSYDDRQIAKDQGFLWDEKRREWYRMMSPEDTGALGFKTVERQ